MTVTANDHIARMSATPGLSGRAEPLRARSADGDRPDYGQWSVEELRALAVQLQLPDARNMTRAELLSLFDPFRFTA